MQLNKDNFDQVIELGVILQQYNEYDQRHIGILYKIDDKEARVSHLAWHMELKDEDVKEFLLKASEKSTCVWFQSGLEDHERRLVSIALAGMAERGQLPGIPYSTLYSGKYFEEGTLQYVRDEVGAGLTCATFVMQVFESLGYPVVDVESWLDRPEDIDWQRMILEMLEHWGVKNGVSIEEHVKAIREQPASCRFRPEEVAYCTTRDEIPVTYQEAEPAGRRIVEELTKL
ncbi:hypothetical protein [Kiloniella sp. b19]|uniref:hypothetical protein n=1 Tax=Kiloniella sp. GXU_MW_B19 TaxID=3141326 RepID=UPI0031D61FA6